MARFVITLDDDTETNAKAVIADIIHQAQNGVTVFSHTGILANILLDLDLHLED
jgi:hypothetical protein